MSGDISGCHDQDEGAPGTQGEGAKDAAPCSALDSQAQRKICPEGPRCRGGEPA